MGHTYSDIIRWCNTFYQETPPYLVKFNINAMDFAVTQQSFETFRSLFTCRNNIANYSKEITQQLYDLMFHWDVGQPVNIPLPPPGLGLAEAYSNPGGFITKINEWWNLNIKPSPDYTEEIGKLLGFIHDPVNTPDLLNLSPNAAAKFTGGAVVIYGHLPKPAKYWHLLVDRGDGHGQIELALIAGAKYTDHHELPDKPVTWTYTIELRDKEQSAIGKVSVVSLTVWHGAADHGPEGAGD
jgi:hypothetical protein